ncbi:MAG: hypothetical protein Q4B80_01720 [Aerococcaceae bacterium]|nr:hypothetical protein [Aerococcaceae bacterium]
MNYYTLNAAIEYAQSSTPEIVKSFKITNIIPLDFNHMEGQNYQINLKVITTPKYKNKIVKILTNSTYLDDYSDETQFLPTQLEEHLNYLLCN